MSLRDGRPASPNHRGADAVVGSPSGGGGPVILAG